MGKLFFLAIVCSLALTACQQQTRTQPVAPPAATVSNVPMEAPEDLKPASKPKTWRQIASFAYQLQNIDIDAISSAPYDLVVIDYSSTGQESGKFTK